MKIFSLDSPVISVMSRIADLMWLNILTLICCIPIVTAGASFTAMHYMALKIVRNEESYITRGFLKAFKENFKKATIIWLILLFVSAMIAGDVYLLLRYRPPFYDVFKYATIFLIIVVLFTGSFVFPLLAKFENTVKNTLKNAFLVSILQFPKTLTMIVMSLLPYLLLASFFDMIPIVFLFGLSLPAWASALLYNKFFKTMEDQILNPKTEEEDTEEEDEQEEDVRIFIDESESLAEKND